MSRGIGVAMALPAFFSFLAMFGNSVDGTEGKASLEEDWSRQVYWRAEGEAGQLGEPSFMPGIEPIGLG